MVHDASLAFCTTTRVQPIAEHCSSHWPSKLSGTFCECRNGYNDTTSTLLAVSSFLLAVLSGAGQFIPSFHIKGAQLFLHRCNCNTDRLVAF